jgi:hypothetical protein
LSDAVGTIEYLANELAALFDPLAQRAANGTADSILEWVGLRPPDVSTTADDLTSGISTLASGASALPDQITALATAIQNQDAATVASAGQALVTQFALIVKAAEAVATALQALSTSGGLTPSQQAELAAFAVEFIDRVLNRLFVEYLESRFGQIVIALMATGVIEIVDQPGGPAGSLSGAYTQKTFHFDRAAQMFTKPQDLLSDSFAWGQPGFDGVALFQALQALLQLKFDVPAQLLQPTGMPATLEAFAFSATVDDSLSPPGIDLSVRVPGSATINAPIDLGDWQATVNVAASFPADLTAKITPLFGVALDLSTGNAGFTLDLHFARSATADPFLLLGTAGGSSLQVQSPTADLKLDLQFDPANLSLTIDPQVSVQLQGGKLTVSSDGSDGFLSTLLSNSDIDANFNVGVTWSPSQGIAFVASAGLEIQVPTHISLGPLDISSIVLGAELESDGTIPVELSASFDANLGPLTASVDRMGLLCNFSFPKGGGNLGPANATFAFKPPTGVGLSVDAGIIEGGGFLYIDTEHGQYAGALQLMFADFLSLTAIGIINTKMPDGSSGFSLLIIITADFGAGIQLGFGFALMAVGGLLGLNRSMLFQPLMDDIRTGAIDSIMFPQNVIANAPRIISDLQAVFPPQQGVFLVGPMAKLGWSDGLISLSLGVIVEIPPGDIAILGILQLVLPDEDDAVLLLQVNFAGALEFDKQRLYFFASLYDSHILFITLEGEMGLLMAWGDNGNFVVSVGGFNPQFNPPPLPFPSPQRIEIDIINESFARIRCSGYFAVTSNTVQFGSLSEFFFGFSALNLSGSSGFDVLIQFSPFHLTADISTSFSVNVFGVGCYGIDMDLTLDGPTPWHAHGTASISFLFFSIGISVDFTWGESQSITLPPVAVMPILSGELGKQSNWKAVLPNGSNLLVALRKLDPSESALVLHPVGFLQVSQRAIPLDLTLDKDGTQQPSDANYFTLDVTSGGLSKDRTLQEQFAPAQFTNMDDAAKLSQPAYVPMDSGIELTATGTTYASGTAVTRNVRYDLTVIDIHAVPVFRRFYIFVASLFEHFLNGSSATRCTLSNHLEQLSQPYTTHVSVSAESFAVALQTNNTVFRSDATSFTSQVAAQEYLAKAVAQDPSLADTLHVLPQFEVAA